MHPGDYCGDMNKTRGEGTRTSVKVPQCGTDFQDSKTTFRQWPRAPAPSGGSPVSCGRNHSNSLCATGRWQCTAPRRGGIIRRVSISRRRFLPNPRYTDRALAGRYTRNCSPARAVSATRAKAGRRFGISFCWTHSKEVWECPYA